MSDTDGKSEAKRPYNDWPNDAGFNAETEQREPVELVVKGTIPELVAGTLYRTGPGHYKVQRDGVKKEFSLSHWFDGFTTVHRFQIIPTTEGHCRVLYNSRRQVDDLVDAVRKTGKLDGISFGQKRDPCASLFQKVKSVFESGGNSMAGSPQKVNVGVTIAPNVPGLGSSKPEKDSVRGFENLVNFTDAALIKTLDPDTLEPVGVTNQKVFHPELTGPLSSAHAQFDHMTGDLYNYNLDFGRYPTYRIFKTSMATGKTEILAKITGADVKPAYIHSFFLTDDYIVLAIWPAYVAGLGLSVLWERNMLDALSKFDPEARTLWFVVDRKHGHGLVAKYSSPAVFSFHSINAWQEAATDGTVSIFCDVVEFPNLDILHRFYYDNLVSTGPGVHNYSGGNHENVRPSMARYHLANIPTATSQKAAPTTAAEAAITLRISGPAIGELPTINPHFSTRKERYVYTVVDRGHSSFFDAICKTDLDSRTAIFWECPHHTPGEPIFIPAARHAGGTDDDGTAAEDDGFLLSVVLNGDIGTSYLLCLDARTLQEVGRAECDAAVGFGFHGRFAPSSPLQSVL